MAGGEGSGTHGLCPGILCSLLWFIGLLIFAWPVAFIFCWIYVLFLPFAACCSPMTDFCNALLRLVQLPLTFARNMQDMKRCC